MQTCSTSEIHAETKNERERAQNGVSGRTAPTEERQAAPAAWAPATGTNMQEKRSLGSVFSPLSSSPLLQTWLLLLLPPRSLPPLVAPQALAKACILGGQGQGEAAGKWGRGKKRWRKCLVGGADSSIPSMIRGVKDVTDEPQRPHLTL